MCGTCNNTGFVSRIPDRPELKSGCDDLECNRVQPETQRHNAQTLADRKREEGIR